MESFFGKKQSIERALQLPRRLRNLGLLKTSYYKSKIKGSVHTVVSEQGKFRLLKFVSSHSESKEGASRRLPLLIVPSLINRYTILDLYSGCSVIESLMKSGQTVYLLDWGDSRPQDKHLSLSDHLDHGLAWALKKTLKDADAPKLNLLGQCLGGTLCALYACHDSEKIQSLILLTTPIDFHVEGTFYQWAKHSNINLDEMLAAWGNVQADFLDRSFKMLTPLGDIKQKGALWTFGDREDFLKKHVAISEWVKNSVPFPGQAYKELIQYFYRDNILYQGEMVLEGSQETFSLGTLKKLKVPILSFYAKGDIIVPNQSTRALVHWVGKDNYKEVELHGGHIGCIVGKRGQNTLNTNLNQWLETHDQNS